MILDLRPIRIPEPPDAWPDAIRGAAAVPLAIDPRRGAPARIDGEALGDVLRALAALARADEDGRIVELEVNPLVAGPRGPVLRGRRLSAAPPRGRRARTNASGSPPGSATSNIDSRSATN